MQANFNHKAIDCLELSAAYETGGHLIKYAEISARWSEKAVLRKIEELQHRGYIEQTIRRHLTPKGQLALRMARERIPTTTKEKTAHG